MDCRMDIILELSLKEDILNLGLEYRRLLTLDILKIEDIVEKVVYGNLGSLYFQDCLKEEFKGSYDLIEKLINNVLFFNSNNGYDYGYIYEDFYYYIKNKDDYMVSLVEEKEKYKSYLLTKKLLLEDIFS